MLDFNHRPKIHEQIGVLIDAALSSDRDKQPRRNYLGASRLGVACERALQYEYLQTPVDPGREGFADTRIAARARRQHPSETHRDSCDGAGCHDRH